MSMFLYRDRAKQLIDFSNLSWGKLHPTDIDGIMEFGGNKLILFEYKTKGKDADTGQQILLKRLADNWERSHRGAEAIVIYAEHEQYDTQEDVDAGNARVKEIYYKGRYIDYRPYDRSVKSLVWSFAHNEIQERLNEDIYNGDP